MVYGKAISFNQLMNGGKLEFRMSDKK